MSCDTHRISVRSIISGELAIHPNIFHPQDHITTIPLPGPFNKIFHPFPLLFPKHQCHYFTLCEHGQKLRFRLWILIILVFILVVCLTRIYSYLCLRGELSDSNRN